MALAQNVSAIAIPMVALLFLISYSHANAGNDSQATCMSSLFPKESHFKYSIFTIDADGEEVGTCYAYVIIARCRIDFPISPSFRYTGQPICGFYHFLGVVTSCFDLTLVCFEGGFILKYLYIVD